MSEQYVNMNDDNAPEEGSKQHADYIYDIGEFPVNGEASQPPEVPQHLLGDSSGVHDACFQD